MGDLEKEMATHSIILAWEIRWTEKPGGLQCIGVQRVNLVTKQQQQHMGDTQENGVVHQNCWVQFSSVRCVWLPVNPWTAACQASLIITYSWGLFKLMSIGSVMPSNNLILCRPLLLLPSIFPSIRDFSNESVLPSGGQSIGVSDSASFHPMNIQNWFPLGWTGWIFLQSKGLLFKGLLQYQSSKASILWH